eukprot:scaffold217113_cov36-Tisochrysis_lutea.AAC.4
MARVNAAGVRQGDAEPEPLGWLEWREADHGVADILAGRRAVCSPCRRSCTLPSAAPCHIRATSRHRRSTEGSSSASRPPPPLPRHLLEMCYVARATEGICRAGAVYDPPMTTDQGPDNQQLAQPASRVGAGLLNRIEHGMRSTLAEGAHLVIVFSN